MSIKKLLSVILIIILSNFSLNYGFGKELNVSKKHKWRIFVSKKKEKESNTPPTDPAQQLEKQNLEALKFKLSGLNDLVDTEEETPKPITEKANALVSKSHALYNKVKEESRIVEILNLSKTYDLPLALGKNIGGIDYHVIFDSIFLTPQGGLMNAYMSIEIPSNGKMVAFHGTDLKFTKHGINANAKLTLIEDFPIKMGEKVLVNLKSEKQRTFVNFDCKGFKSLNIDAEIEFSRDLIIPENADGSLNTDGKRVKAAFEISDMSEWGSLITKINLSPFQVRGIPGFTFTVTDAIFDYSDIANPPGIVFPGNYTTSSSLPLTSPFWQGVYVKSLTVTLPKQFKTSDKKRIEMAASDLIMDDMGVSGGFSVKNLFPLEKGDMDGWDYSVDSIGVTLLKNELVAGGLAGKIAVPIFDTNDPLKYNAIIGKNGSYAFSAATTGSKKVEMWGADLDIREGSSFEIRVSEEKFLPKAILNGNLSIGGKKDAEVSLKDISFEGLEIQTIKPYFSVKAFSLGSKKEDQTLSGFPLKLNDIGFATKDEKVGIVVGASVNFVGDNDGGFAGESTFEIWGERKVIEGKTKWAFSSIDINEIKIDINGGVFKFNGNLVSYKEDPTYGKGFKGVVNATFTPGLNVSVNLQFGRVRNFRYWYADALATLPNGVVIAPGFSLYGFGGGAYYHMKQQFVTVSLPSPDAKLPEEAKVGKSVSGIVYVPDESVFLGIKATVTIGTAPSPQPFNADATFEIAFTKDGGVDLIEFNGKGYFLTDMKDRQGDPPLFASVDVEYNFTNKELYGKVDVYVNVAGVMRGGNANNKAGSATLYFGEKDWYIHIGNPDERIALNFANLFDAQSYLMIGTIIPPMPDLPANVTGILGENTSMMRDENALKSGGGFAFGSSLNMSTGDLNFLMFYGRFDAGGGFDIMLKNYGQGVRCNGSSKPLGINGWYASGQAYAYVQGKIGIRVDLDFYKGNFDIIKLGAAASLQAKLPNPFWMQGQVGGHFSILGGLVSGKCKFDMTIGEKCQIVGESAISGIKVIAETSPALNEKEVSVFNVPQATFNMEVGKEFAFTDLQDNRKSIKIVLDHFKLTDGGNEITGALQWNETKDVVGFKAFEILPAKKTIKMSVKVHFEELENGVWRAITANGKVAEESKESIFITGDAPPNIPAHNVLYSYPILNQYNFYPEEHNKGFVQLNFAQHKLFEPGNEWKQVLRLETKGYKSDHTFIYNKNEKKISFDLPSGMPLNKICKMSIVNVPVTINARLDDNVINVVNDKLNEGESKVSVETKEVEGNYTVLEEKEIFASFFRTSQFAKFADKITAVNNSVTGWSWPIYMGIHEIGTTLSGNELFDVFEIKGQGNIPPIIQFEAVKNNNWINNQIFPMLYEEYPLNGNIYITYRKTDSLGVLPVKAINLRQVQENSQISEENYLSQFASSTSPKASIVYNLPYHCYKDYYHLKEKAAIQASMGNSSKAMRNLIEKPFPGITTGLYNLKIKYTIPGLNLTTTEKELSINNP